MRRAKAAWLALLLWAAVPSPAASTTEFDFFVLSLSWSPAFCAASASRSPQCETGAATGFVVHGLWPQFERGYPEFCGDPGSLSDALVASMLDIMPDRSLVAHEWEKHGTCAGMTPEAYFGVTREAFARVRVPEDLAAATADDRETSVRFVEKAFIDANPGLAHAGVAVTCEDGRLDEVRICMTRTLAFRACPEVDRRGCRVEAVTLTAGR